MDSKLMSDWPCIRSKKNSDGSNVDLFIVGIDCNCG